MREDKKETRSPTDGKPDKVRLDRREALKLGTVGFGLAVVGTSAGCTIESHANDFGSPPNLGEAPLELFSAPSIDQVRIGYVGVGLQGSAHVRNLLRIEGCVIQAVCDIVPEKVQRVQDQVEQAGFPRPTGYARGQLDFQRLCQEEDLD
ncbi:uncharacterized protein METZ01_LOCUS168461, partial [marine metagenome]